MSVSSETGLPSLPDGYFWRVNETSVEIRKTLPDTKWIPILDGCTRVLAGLYNLDIDQTRETKQGEPYTVQEQMKNWWGLTRKKTRTLHPILERAVNRSQRILIQFTKEVGRETVPGSIYPPGHKYYRPEFKQAVYAKVTEDEIRRIASELIDKFGINERAKGLVGDYPPKKLGEA